MSSEADPRIFRLEEGSRGNDAQESWLKASGEMDVLAGSEVSQLVRHHLDLSRRVVVDLTEVTFMDSSGVAAILKAGRSPEERSRIALVPSRHRQPARLAELTGMAEMFIHVDPS